MGKNSGFFKNISRATGLSFRFLPGLTASIFLVSMVTALAPIFQAKILGDIVNKMIASITSGVALSSMTVFVLLYASIWGLIRILGSLETYIWKVWNDKVKNEFEVMILRKRTEIDLGHHESPEFQNLLMRAFSRGVAGPLIEIVADQFSIVTNIAIILVSSAITASIGGMVYVIIILTSIPSFIVQLKYGRKVWGIYDEHSERQKRYSSMKFQLTSRTGIVQTKLLQNTESVLAHIKDALVSFQRDNTKLDRERFIFQSITSVVSASGFGFSLWIISNNVMRGETSVGQMVFIISALGSLVGALNILLARLATQLERNLYLTDVFKVLDTKPYVPRPLHPIKLHLTIPPVIEFRNVSFKYEGRDDWILRNVNLTIESGEKIALVGMNGAGKSTLIKLLSRIYDPVEGDIFVNDINLKELDLDEWGSNLSALLQDYLTYDLSAKEAIAMGRTSAELDLDRVIQSSEYSGASEFIEGWENKYDQQLGKEFESGIEPSKGQNQKLALARTIYRDALIMVLDEPTAAIDALSETQIFKAMEKAVGQNTLIVITHRFNTTQGMDKIIVLEHGTVEEIGTHKELIEKKGLYHEMFESQAKAFRNETEE